MKSYCLLASLAACLLLSACEKTPNLSLNHSVNLTWADCPGFSVFGTKAEAEERNSWLVLEHTPDGLGITITDVDMNCAISHYGLTENVTVEGNTIYYEIQQNLTANCSCRIKEISSTIKGLEEGKTYVLNYSIAASPITLKPIRFTYKHGLKKYVNVEKNIGESRIIHGSE